MNPETAAELARMGLVTILLVGLFVLLHGTINFLRKRALRETAINTIDKLYRGESVESLSEIEVKAVSAFFGRSWQNWFRKQS